MIFMGLRSWNMKNSRNLAPVGRVLRVRSDPRLPSTVPAPIRIFTSISLRRVVRLSRTFSPNHKPAYPFDRASTAFPTHSRPTSDIEREISSKVWKGWKFSWSHSGDAQLASRRPPTKCIPDIASASPAIAVAVQNIMRPRKSFLPRGIVATALVPC
jgi:hypothetical protein